MMKALVVPHASGANTADVWIGIQGSRSIPPAGRLHVGSSSWPISAGSWQRVTVSEDLPQDLRTVWHQSVTLHNLQPGRRRRIDLLLQQEHGEEPVASGYVSTIPEALPRIPDQPYVVLLGSCFAWYQDQAGIVGLNVKNLPEPYKPDFKILCGDQVYLDNPAIEMPVRTRASLATRLFQKYAETWFQGDQWCGFGAFLSDSCTYFMADDHEFWNNHPNWSPLLTLKKWPLPFINQWDDQTWIRYGEDLYAAFQSPGLGNPQQFSLGSIDFFLLDTRFSRQKGSANFTDHQQLTQMTDWLAQLNQNPVVLVIGAPVCTAPAGRLASWLADRSLANYQQYELLSDAILSCRRSLLVLTGDIHFNRIASAAPQRAFFELAVSPLALVSEKVGGKFEKAPEKFPLQGTRASLKIETKALADRYGKAWDGWPDHFATLSFTETDQAVHIEVVVWRIGKTSPHHPVQSAIDRIELPRRLA
jgi:hypothetical protein